MADTRHRTPRERAAHASAAAAVARAQAHIPATADDDWPDPAPTGEIPLHHQYPITPAGARARRIHIEETRNHG